MVKKKFPYQFATLSVYSTEISLSFTPRNGCAKCVKASVQLLNGYVHNEIIYLYCSKSRTKLKKQQLSTGDDFNLTS